MISIGPRYFCSYKNIKYYILLYWYKDGFINIIYLSPLFELKIHFAFMI